ncbi:hypothetical protein H5410_036077 [Solanum commersonii]|uniref:Uncharacterized protein n=1 Tax=Solanum commersonii TaxID=4109 RepID=A0A9J5Y3Q0_SOLCO|nr:hypothetical protein H5410_036077 [Solanum commersonii]
MVNEGINDTSCARKGSITHIDYATPHSSRDDTEKFYTEVQEIILARYNKTFDWSLKAKMMGKKAIEAARVFVEEMRISDLLTAEDFLVEREEMLQKMFPTSDLMPVNLLYRHPNWTEPSDRLLFPQSCKVQNKFVIDHTTFYLLLSVLEHSTPSFGDTLLYLMEIAQFSFFNQTLKLSLEDGLAVESRSNNLDQLIFKSYRRQP